ncbi:MAG: hypothetical protein ABJB10_07735, partial [Mesorhizobium sp.]
NPEISTQRADTLTMTGKILPGPGKMAISPRQWRAITVASDALSIFDVGSAVPALSKTAPSGYTDPEIWRTRLVAIRVNFEFNAFRFRQIDPSSRRPRKL